MSLCRLTARTFGLIMIATVLLPALSVLAQTQETERPIQLVESFDLLPSQYQLILAVPDLKTLSDQAAEINDQLKLQITGLADLLNEFKRAMGMERGVHNTGSMFLVVENIKSLLPPSALDQKEGRPVPTPRFVALIPVSDYAEFAANFGGSADDRIATLTLPAGQTAYSKIYKGYAIISASQKSVQDYTPGLTRKALAQNIGKRGIQVLTHSDINLILKLQGIPNDVYEQLVDLFKPSPPPADEVSAQNFSDPDQKTSGQIIANVYHNALLRLTKDSDHIVLGFNSTDQGMDINMAMTFKTNSNMARVFTGDTSGTTILNRLPNRDYLYSFATALDQVQTRILVENLAEELSANNAWYAPVIKEAAPLFEQIQDIAQVLYAPQEAIGLSTRIMNIVMVLKVRDAQQFVSGFEKYLTQTNGKSYPMGPMILGETQETDSRPQVFITSLFAANALSDDRAKIAQYQFQYNMPIRVQAQMSELSRRMMVLGLNNQEGYIAAVDKDTVILTTATDAQLIKKTLTLLNKTKAEGLGQTPSLIKANAQGLKNASGQLHLNGVNVMRTTHMLIELLIGKQGLDPVFPDQLMPLTLHYKTLNKGLQAKVHLPLNTIAYLRGDAMTILEPLFPEPEVNPNEPNARNRNPNQQDMEMDPGMMGDGMFDNQPPSRRKRRPIR